MFKIVLYAVAFILAESRSSFSRDDCESALINAEIDVNICAFENSFDKYLPQLKDKSMTAEEVMDKFCNEMSLTDCIRSFKNETNSCLSESEKFGVDIGMKVMNGITEHLCNKEIREKFTEILNKETSCEEVSVEAFDGCGQLDIMGIVHGFGPEGCRILRDTIDCNLDAMDFSGKCSDQALLFYRDSWNVIIDITPCRNDEIQL